MVTVIIDGADISSMEQAHSLLAEALSFPEWYGRNLDALYDCLTSLTEPCLITLANTDLLAERLGEKAGAFLAVLRDAAADCRRLTVEG